MKVETLGRGFAWLDTGSYDGLADALDFVKTIQKRAGLYVACLEKIAYHNKWITKSQVMETIKELGKTDYGQYLLSIVEE